MKIDPGMNNPAKRLDAPEHEISCTDCRTAEHLIIESVQSMIPRRDGWVAVDYSCGNCEAYYAHDVPVQAVAHFLATADMQAGVLKFGRHYIHCGEPMEESAMEMEGLAVDEGDLQDAPDVHLAVVVLRCRCGFQFAVPK